MRIDGKPYRTIWVADDGWGVEIIDQTRLPHSFKIARLATLEDAVGAIRDMQVRGAPLIGATAAYGVALALRAEASQAALDAACQALLDARPTAVNLRWALDEMRAHLAPLGTQAWADAAYGRAGEIVEEDVEICRMIGVHGRPIIEELAQKKPDGEPVNILTHCNAGWLATTDWGTATSPIYQAHDAGVGVHVWVDETRPRNQGAALTAFELGQHGVPHTVIADNTGGHLMQTGRVDMAIVGTDRTTAAGDVCNKIGTYLKALAAHDTGVPFYVALPGPTIDWTIDDGRDIPIEERGGEEVSHLTGLTAEGRIETVDVVAPGSACANFAFDVTPARLVTGLITERGVAEACKPALAALYPEKAE